MNNTQLHQIAHWINSYALHSNTFREGEESFKGVYLKQIYRLNKDSKAKEYLVKFYHDHTTFYLYINVGSYVNFYINETPEIKSWCENALTGRHRDGFSNAVIKYTDNKKLVAVLPCPNRDKALILCFSNGVTWRIDFFGTGQSILRTGEKVIYWNPEATEAPVIEYPSMTIDELLKLRSNCEMKEFKMERKVKAKKERKEKKSKEEYLALQKQSHLEKANKLINRSEETLLNSFEEGKDVDWKELTKTFTEAKHSIMKANRVADVPINTKSSKKKLELELIKKKYDCYHKSYTVNGFLVLGSKDATQVSQLINSYNNPKNLYFHIDEHGGSSVLLIMNQEKEFEPIDIENAADCAVCWSRQNSSSVSNEFPVYYLSMDQISLNAPSGLYLSQGSVFCIGKKNYLSSRSPKTGFSLKDRGGGQVELISGPLSLQDKSIYCLNTTTVIKPKKKISNDLKNLLTSSSYGLIVKEL